MYFVKPYPPPSGTDKVMPLHAQTALFESRNILFPRSASWLTEYLRELAAFPGGKFDDQVDSTTQAFEYFTSVLRKLTIYDVL
jgi:predicted phage terminase large subunit-like protein